MRSWKKVLYLGISVCTVLILNGIWICPIPIWDKLGGSAVVLAFSFLFWMIASSVEEGE